jgi:LysM repeat protein
MNTPNPLIPQGSLQNSKGKSTVRIIVFSIIAMHSVFFAGLLMQGCNKEGANKGDQAGTKPLDLTNSTSEISKPDTNYYAGLQELPPAFSNPAPASNLGTVASNDLAHQTYQPPAQQAAPSYQLPASNSNTGAIGGVEPQVETKEYTIARGDSLYKIAKNQGITIADITKVNPDLDPSKLKPGQKIQVPASSKATSSMAAALSSTGSPDTAHTESGATRIHVVKAGDNLTKVARQYGVSIKALRTANNLKTDRLLANQKLKIPANGTKTASASGSTNSSKAPQPENLSTNR